MKNLTLRYSLTQFAFWAASSGAAGFATAYLLGKGIPSGAVGAMLACAGLLSSLVQPLIAAAVDRAKKFVLVRTLLAMSGLCCLCFCLQLVSGLPLLLSGIAYVLGLCCSDTMVPLLNAMSVAYNRAGFSINYGAARGIGSAATAIASLILGYIIAQFGTPWMIGFILLCRIASMAILAGFPEIAPEVRSREETGETISVAAFFLRYRWYCLSLVGIAFLGMFHAMTENYLIAILGALGGDSSHVGVALFISAMVGAPAIFFCGRIRKHISDGWILRIAALSFLLKAVLFYFTKSIAAIYCIQLLQITSYGFLAPAQVYYAGAKVQPCDMVKGQAFATAAYALGCSGGNFAGGQLLHYGVDSLLLAGIAMALAGTLLLFATVHKTDVS